MLVLGRPHHPQYNRKMNNTIKIQCDRLPEEAISHGDGHVTDRRADERAIAIAYSALSIGLCAVCCRALKPNYM